MAEIIATNLPDDDRLFEEEFLLAAQCEIQRLLNDKQLRHRDLSKRLGVSEARVSQMLRDEASNLTIRTIARIFRKLGEEPVLMTRRAHDRIAAGLDRQEPTAETAWTMVTADVSRFAVDRVNLIDERELEPTSHGRSSRSNEWLVAEPNLARRTA